MNFDLGSLVLIAIIVVAVVLLIKRMMPTQTPYNQRVRTVRSTTTPTFPATADLVAISSPIRDTTGLNMTIPILKVMADFGPAGGSRSGLDQLAHRANQAA